MRVRTLVPGVTLALVALAGCQPLKHENTYSMEPQIIQKLTPDTPRYQQKVTVAVKPSGGPVAAYICKSDDLDKVMAALDRDKEPPADLLLGSHAAKAEEFSFEATVPAKTEYTVLLKNGPKKNEVSVKLTGR